MNLGSGDALDVLDALEQDSESTYFAFNQATAPEPARTGKGRRKRRGKGRAPATTQAPAATPVRALPPLPDVLAGRYRLERLLGAGGMGRVYRARDLLQERFGDPQPLLALKLMSDQLATAPDANALLFNEYALTSRLRHPNLVRLQGFAVDPESDRGFITMELMRGTSLDRLLCDQPMGLAWAQVREIAVPLLDVLACVHAQGVVHGDLKPSNVMLTDDGLRLFDFGLGMALEGPLAGLPHLSHGRFEAWTPAYAAPELFEGGTPSTASDLYAVACVLYELVTGRHPFDRVLSLKAREQGLQHALRVPENMPAKAWTALRTALVFDPGQRSIGAAQLRDAFAARGFWSRFGK
ncbi:serine/threonine-protein kinase [Pseudomonas entomophila]|uniref:Serine-threonine kinase Stk1 n=2 Tax=Pseudomonas entomophila TaxID=312306 RepID=Q1IFR9_PSEE4|nr:serine/threonine-protein kinase [Pseudomonas entomophila]WMW05675.1 serine/threonine-protein kinase [Pseudomonas entomophila]CAK13483.1 Serine-threonine kinase Stk1 [Pseudomonas entomophila L48]